MRKTAVPPETCSLWYHLRSALPAEWGWRPHRVPSHPSPGRWRGHSLDSAWPWREEGSICPWEHRPRVGEVCFSQLQPWRRQPHCFLAKCDVTSWEEPGKFFLHSAFFCSLISLQAFSFTFWAPFSLAFSSRAAFVQLTKGGLCFRWEERVICSLQCRCLLCEFPDTGGY